MATSVTDKLFEALPRLAGKVGAGGVVSNSATTIPHTFVGLTDGHCYIVTANRTNATGTTKNQLNETETFIGKVSAGNFIECVREVEGAAQAWAADTVLEILFTATIWNKLVEAILVQHGQDGVHTSALITSLKASGAEVNTGTSEVKIVTPKAIADSYLGGATSSLQTQINDGWVKANESWTYASATTITVPSGAALKYQKGDKTRIKQGGAYKYFYIVLVADTLLTVNGGDTTVANAAITDNYYSHVSNPLDFPVGGLVYTPVIQTTANCGTISNTTFAINNGWCFARGKIAYANALASGNLGITAPITCAITNPNFPAGFAHYLNAGTADVDCFCTLTGNNPGVIYFYYTDASASNDAGTFVNSSAWSSTDVVDWIVSYPCF